LEKELKADGTFILMYRTPERMHPPNSAFVNTTFEELLQVRVLGVSRPLPGLADFDFMS
jgi:hypothetical protein